MNHPLMTHKPRHLRCALVAVALMLTSLAYTAQAEITCPVLDDAYITPYVGTWQGQLGASAIEVYLEPHAEDAQRLQGHYIHTAHPAQPILIVAEPLKGVLEMEESRNGSDVSGLWALVFPEKASTHNRCVSTLQGEWLDGNFANPQPVTLHREVSW